ncbi:hypothetical protein GW17_00048158 [Ensete ventricosum]|nr:hypothetical protein GW17_00048158 [Ensete ventricosum]
MRQQRGADSWQGIFRRLTARKSLLCPLYRASRDDGLWPLQVLFIERTEQQRLQEGRHWRAGVEVIVCCR